MVVFDREMRVLAAEGPALEQVGLHQGDIEGKRPRELLPAGDGDRLELALEAANTGHERTFEWTTATGGAAFQLAAEPMRDDRGQISGVLLAALDVTELRTLRTRVDAASRAGRPPRPLRGARRPAG